MCSGFGWWSDSAPWRGGFSFEGDGAAAREVTPIRLPTRWLGKAMLHASRRNTRKRRARKLNAQKRHDANPRNWKLRVPTLNEPSQRGLNLPGPRPPRLRRALRRRGPKQLGRKPHVSTLPGRKPRASRLPAPRQLSWRLRALRPRAVTLPSEKRPASQPRAPQLRSAQRLRRLRPQPPKTLACVPKQPRLRRPACEWRNKPLPNKPLPREPHRPARR